jgi:NIMA (never in mitosis gene a)-related kinase
MRMVDVSRMDARQTATVVEEVKMLSRLRHPYLIAYHETFMEGGLLCIVTEYAEGGDLSAKIAKVWKLGESFSEQQILRWFAQAALGIKYMHDKMIPHRNLKSRNLFLTASGGLHVGDYGISKVLERSLASACTNVKAVQYLSPEICQDGPESLKGDVWALGCVLFEMAALRLPFDEPNVAGLVLKIIRGPTPQFPKQYSGDLRKLCNALLLRDPEKRPSALEVLQWPLLQQEIRRMLNEEPARTLPSTPREPRQFSMASKLRPTVGNSVLLPRLLAPQGTAFRPGHQMSATWSQTWYGGQQAVAYGRAQESKGATFPGASTIPDGSPMPSASKTDGFKAQTMSSDAATVTHSGIESGEVEGPLALRSQMPPQHCREFPSFD